MDLKAAIVWFSAGIVIGVLVGTMFARRTVVSKFQWDQEAPDAATAQSYTYAAYVDGIKVPLTGVSCAPGARPTCTVPLPPMAPGTHRLALTSSIDGKESNQSPPLEVEVIARLVGQGKFRIVRRTQ
jgi:hypothetical protein